MKQGLESSVTLPIVKRHFFSADTYGAVPEQPPWTMYVSINPANHFMNWSISRRRIVIFHELSHIAGVPNDDNASGWWTESAINVEKIANYPSSFHLQLMLNFIMWNEDGPQTGGDGCGSSSDWMP